MSLPKIRSCPGCGGDPLPFREGLDTPGMSCNKCGFSASGRDVMRADYLVNLRPFHDIRVAAQRISMRLVLNYGLARARD